MLPKASGPCALQGLLWSQLPAPAIAKSLAESATPWDEISDAKGKMKTQMKKQQEGHVTSEIICVESKIHCLAAVSSVQLVKAPDVCQSSISYT